MVLVTTFSLVKVEMIGWMAVLAKTSYTVAKGLTPLSVVTEMTFSSVVLAMTSQLVAQVKISSNGLTEIWMVVEIELPTLRLAKTRLI